MHYPLLIAIPLLMLADYALTVLGVQWADTYRQHFVAPTYELNPRWRESVAQRRWFNPRHLLLVGLVTLLLWLLDRWAPPVVVAWLLGIVLGVLGALLSRHVSNLLTFRYLNRHPEAVTGQVQYSLATTLKLSQYGYAGLLPLLGLLLALAPSPAMAGAVLGVLGLILAHGRWARNDRNQE